MNLAVAQRKYQHMQAVSDQTQRLKATLRVCLPQVFYNECRLHFEVASRFKRQTAFGYIGTVFGHVVRNVHANNCTPNIYNSQFICTPDK